jgi:selenocysteine-specific elongation factor
MKSVIVGTAGHIDHGKTALVKALTGTDADRLAEEKRRGITIDLGFAHLEISSGGELFRFGFVDVPGHERFVRNMLAGVGGIDLVILIIAADEGIKPQTREHFEICRLLSVKRGITVITKSDLVDPETLGVVRMEIEDFVRGSFLDASTSPVVAVSSVTGAGLAELKDALLKSAAQVSPRDSAGLVRLPIDRVFTMKGFGTVVTGTLISGTIRNDDELKVFPGRRKIRVRGVQVHGETAQEAIAGERTALNLAAVEKSDLSRGMMLAPPGMLEPTTRIDARLNLLPSAQALKKLSRVHFHAFTAEAIARISFERNSLQPGDAANARLTLSAPVLLFPGDRFIIRRLSPVVTIGGGEVLDAFPVPKLKPETVAHLLAVSAAHDHEKALLARIARRAYSGSSTDRLAAETGWSPQQIRKMLAPAVARGIIVHTADRWFDLSAIEALKASIVSALETFHAGNPLSAGLAQETLREQSDVEGGAFQFAMSALAGEGRIKTTGDLAHLAGRGVVMKNEESESRDAIESAFAASGLQVPALKDVLAGLKIDKVRAQKIVTLLLRDKVLVKVSDDLVFHRSALAGLRASVAEQKLKSPTIDVAGFKTLTGVSRKYAIPLLEYLDRERITRRIGDQRVIL